MLDIRKSGKRAIASGQNIRERDYWLEKLAGEPARSHFPYDRHQVDRAAYSLAAELFDLSGELYARLHRICGGADAKMHIILTAAALVLLERYSGNRDIVVAVPIYRQDEAGEFINTVLAVRCPLHPGTSFRELIMTVHRTVFEANQHQNYPIETLLYQLNMETDQEGECPLFDLALLLENIHEPAYIRHLKLNMFWIFNRSGDTLSARLEYNSGRFRPATVRRIVAHFNRLLDRVLFAVDVPVDEAEILSAEERRYLLSDLNTMDSPYPARLTIVQLFDQQVDRHPRRTVLVMEHHQFTYGLLNRRSLVLAGALGSAGAGPGHIVALLLERSLHLSVAILAVLKAGGAYLPVDADYPPRRIRFMLKDSSAGVLVSDCPDALPEGLRGTIRLLEPDPLETEGELVTPSADPEDPAYLIYTSGTTGTPKGVLIEHRQVVRLMFHHRFLFDFGPQDVWTLFHSYCFDFSVWEMYGALLYGGKLIVIPLMVARDPEKFLQMLRDQQVTVLNQTPSAFYWLMNEELQRQAGDLNLKYVIFGGEALAPGRLKEWWSKYPATRLINMFGITETTVHVTFKQIGEVEIFGNIGNIGRPIPTLGTFVMDGRLRLAPPGVPGELCVGGAGLGRGYLNRPDLTDERFVRIPGLPAPRLYRSGDRVRLREDGDLEYMGRIDNQVKIRGFRIELGEIESRLQDHRDIREAVVLAGAGKEASAGTDGAEETSLCAYIAARRQLTAAEVKDYLAGYLPEHMIPPYIVQMEKIPLTANGKVDRKRLPVPEMAADGDYVPPVTAVQMKLAEIWGEIFQRDKVGIRDNFFNVGGDSIRAIKLLNVINKRLNIHLRIPDLYLNETIEKLAKKIEQGTLSHWGGEIQAVLSEIEALKKRCLDTVSPAEADRIEDLYPMSDIERGMIFHSLKDRGGQVYHDQLVYQVVYPSFDPARFHRAFALLVRMHPLLRSAFDLETFEQQVQLVYREVDLDIEHRDLSHLESAGQEAYLKNVLREDRQDPFDLAVPPLWRLRSYDLGRGRIAVVWIVHHSIIDGWSNATLMTELNNTYLALKGDADYVPPPLKYKYRNFVAEQMVEKRDPDAVRFWRSELDGYRRLELAVSPGRGRDRAGSRVYRRRLGHTLLDELRAAARQLDTSVKNLCFAAYVYSLSMLSYEKDLVAGLVTNCRPVCEEGDRLLGCFLNTVPVRMRLPGNISWRDYGRFIDRKLASLKKYERIPLYEITRIIGEKADSRNPLFDTFMNFIDFHVFGQVRQEDTAPAGSGDVLAVEGYERTNTLLDFMVGTTMGRFLLSIHYDAAAVTGETAALLGHCFEGVLRAFIHGPDILQDSAALLPPQEKRRLLFDLNDTAAPFPAGEEIPHLFARRAEGSPDLLPLLDGADGARLSYRQLSRRVRQLAARLRAEGLKRGGVAAVMMARSPGLLIAVLAILETGGAYLPIDLRYPSERIKYMLADSRARVLVTDRREITDSAAADPSIGTTMVDPADTFGTLPRIQPLSPASTAPAYVIYTSGSTGRPKGTLVEHGSVVNILSHLERLYPLGEEDAYLFKTNYTFDVSVTEMFGWFFGRGRVVVPPPGQENDPAAMAETISRFRVTHINFVPSMLNAFLDAVSDLDLEQRLACLRYVLVAGEAFTAALAGKAARSGLAAQFENIFGPTEAAIYTTWYSLPRGDEPDTVPIGKPLANIEVYIVDRRHQLLPGGAVGELCIGGAGLSRGYLNRPELTAEKFIPYPFPEHPGGNGGLRLYKTGDLARLLPDGHIEFLGRIDHQVKIRGYRIEPGEVERRLLQHDNITEAVVLPLTDDGGSQYLCAYVVAAGSPVYPPSLREYLVAKLPHYMVPAHFVQLEKLPLTPSKKVNRQALPAVDHTVMPVEEYEKPRSETEEIMASVWQEVLRVEQVGVGYNFFELGGDSIKAIQIVSRLRKAGLHLEIADMLLHPTIKQAAGRARRLNPAPDSRRVQPEPAAADTGYTVLENEDLTEIEADLRDID